MSKINDAIENTRSAAEAVKAIAKKNEKKIIFAAKVARWLLALGFLGWCIAYLPIWDLVQLFLIVVFIPLMLGVALNIVTVDSVKAAWWVIKSGGGVAQVLVQEQYEKHKAKQKK